MKDCLDMEGKSSNYNVIINNDNLKVKNRDRKR